jgi:hypothetical protein
MTCEALARAAFALRSHASIRALLCHGRRPVGHMNLMGGGMVKSVVPPPCFRPRQLVIAVVDG